MAFVKFLRGEKEVIKKHPLKDGQIIIGTLSDKSFTIYIDIKNKNDELIRFELDLDEYTNKITELDNKVKTLEELLSKYTSETYLTISDVKDI